MLPIGDSRVAVHGSSSSRHTPCAVRHRFVRPGDPRCTAVVAIESFTADGTRSVPATFRRRRWLHLFLAAVVAAAGGLACAAAEDAGQRNLIRVRQKPEEEPWLRINAGGHTAAVEALCFTPDSTRLCSAGLDKVVQVWNLSAVTRDLRRVFLRERIIRWQVARGLRGSIYAIASSPGDGLLAIGGYGAMGSLGEILLVNPLDGSLVKVLEGHRQTICSLSFSADGQWLASSDTGGATRLWKRGQWQPTVLYEPDEKTYGAEKAALIANQPKLRPIVIAGSHVVLPVFVGEEPRGRLQWQLAKVSLTDTKDFHTLGTVHYGMVSALTASADGARLASADLQGSLYVWNLADGRAERLPATAPAASLSFSPDGRTLAAGTMVAPSTGESQLQLWDVAARRIVRSRKLPDHVRACAISPDARRLAYAGGKDNEVFVEALDAPDKTITLAGTGKRILKVAFAKEEPFYRIAFGTDFHDRGFNDYADLQASFDMTRSALRRDGPINPSDWLTGSWLQAGWQAKPLADGSLQLSENGVPKGTVVLDPRLEGKPRSYCWIADRQGKPLAIAVGTDVQDSIYVYRLVEKGPCPILRHFRGHHDYVTSLALSRDLRYLVSGSADGTMMVWSLSDLQRGAEPRGRWAPISPSAASNSSLRRSIRPVLCSAEGCARETSLQPSAGRPNRPSRERSNRPRSSTPCRSCPGPRKWSLKPATTAPPGLLFNSFPPGSRW